jgi:hypothetical protein
VRPSSRQATPAIAAPPVFTFADLARLYETFAKGRKRTWKDDVAKIEKYLLPAWGAMPLRDITRRHVHELLDKLAAQTANFTLRMRPSNVRGLFSMIRICRLTATLSCGRVHKNSSEASCEGPPDCCSVCWLARS